MTFRFQKPQGGFTIVELMIATMVFSVILTVITAGVISFSNRYYRAANSAATQNTAQVILDTVSQAIQFGDAFKPDITHLREGYVCAGGQVFMYAARTSGEAKFTSSGSQIGFQVAPQLGDDCAVAGSGGRQLLSKNMRLTHLELSENNNVYTMSLSIAYGDNDLLCDPSIDPQTSDGGCDPSAAPLSDIALANLADVKCKASTGSQYCAVSMLTTSVQKRVGSN